MSTATLSRWIEGLSRQGRDLLQRTPLASLLRGGRALDDRAGRMTVLARALLSTRGEASGVALAGDLLAAYAGASAEQRQAFFALLATDFGPDSAAVAQAFARYQSEGDAALGALAAAVEAPRQELFRRLNLAPGGTAALVALRADLLAAIAQGRPELRSVDEDLGHLLQSWFNRGFLQMRAIDWSSPASLLERVIHYEAVHDIRDWDELRRRLAPPDRRCYGFFHPSLPEEPLIFVEVALGEAIAASIDAILAPDRVAVAAEEATTAIFYSISNCQPGLKGISFGHFLIKQVAADLKRDLPGLETFVTLSPVPGFRSWLAHSEGGEALMERFDAEEARFDADDSHLRQAIVERVTAYLVEAKGASGKPLDPVARFHLGNGAQLEQVNWGADRSAKGLRQSAGIMVNYLYDLRRIEENHEAYVDHGTIVTGPSLSRQSTKNRKTSASQA